MRRALGRFPFQRDLGELPVHDVRDPGGQVTVLMATYNRSNVLRHAIASLRAQTYPDWQALVIGDACTDDTAEVVASFADPRIRYIDLPINTGDHSGPNSIGARLAHGTHVAWLSQDDLWFPDHLERLLDAVATSGADGAIGGYYVVRKVGPGGLGDPTTRVERRSATGRLRVTRHRNHPASSWLIAASTLARVGDWRRATTIRYATSQEYLYRIWASGARVVLSPTPTLVLVPSIVGNSAYSSRRDVEQSGLAPVVIADDRAGFEEAVSRTSPERFRLPEGIGVVVRHRSPISRAIRRHSELLHRVLAGPLARLGVPPWELAGMLVGEVRGESDAILRMMRGLPGSEVSALSGDLVRTLRAQLDAAETRLEELTAELIRTQNDYRARDQELRELTELYAQQAADLARALQDLRDREAATAEPPIESR